MFSGIGLEQASKSGEYELALLIFHDGLRKRDLAGFVNCFAFKPDSFPWESTSSIGYEDWYLVSDFSSLGTLNEGTISEEVRKPHDTVASYADGGTSGVYKLHGEIGSNRIEFATWFAKPRGLPYQDLKAEIERMKIRGYWQRQMVLGPGPGGISFQTLEIVRA